jgi:glucose/mannose-6-phosphate isomerase
MNLDRITDIARIDKENMLELLVSFPKQCEDALSIGRRITVPKPYRRTYAHIVFTGLGGSAIGADIIKGYCEDEARVPIFVNRDYTLPRFVGRDSLVLTVSYSGNTEETLSAYREAKRRRARVVAVTSGGKLARMALKNKDMLVTIPGGYPPRCALGFSFIPALSLLAKLGLVGNKENDIRQALRYLRTLEAERIGPHVREARNIAKKIARDMHSKFAVIYAADKHMHAVVTRWRGQLAENSKVLSSGHVFPEMNHNEITGWVHPEAVLKKCVVLLLKDRQDHGRVKRRMSISASILKREKFKVLELESRGSHLLERMLSLVYIGDFVSFYLAILNATDPTPVDRITYLKKQLAA